MMKMRSFMRGIETGFSELNVMAVVVNNDEY